MKNTFLIIMLFVAETTFGQNTTTGSAVASNSVEKLAGIAAIQYVRPEGNDSNNGSSWETAKRTVMAALQALPGGSTGTAGHGNDPFV